MLSGPDRCRPEGSADKWPSARPQHAETSSAPDVNGQGLAHGAAEREPTPRFPAPPSRLRDARTRGRASHTTAAALHHADKTPAYRRHGRAQANDAHAWPPTPEYSCIAVLYGECPHMPLTGRGEVPTVCCGWIILIQPGRPAGKPASARWFRSRRPADARRKDRDRHG